MKKPDGEKIETSANCPVGYVPLGLLLETMGRILDKQLGLYMRLDKRVSRLEKLEKIRRKAKKSEVTHGL